MVIGVFLGYEGDINPVLTMVHMFLVFCPAQQVQRWMNYCNSRRASNQGSQKGRRQIWKSPIAYHMTDCIKMMYVKFGRYRLKKDYVRAQAWHDLQGGHRYLGRSHRLPCICTFFENQCPAQKHVSDCRRFCGGLYDLQGWNNTRLENDHLILQSTEHFSSCGKS